MIFAGNGLRGAGVDAAAAGAAAIGGGIVVRKFEIGDDFPEENPGADVFVDDAGVFAEPTDPGAGGELFFHDRGGIDAATRLCVGDERVDGVGKRVQFGLDVLVV